MKAVVLLSGGQDSTTCLYWAKERFEDVHAVSFDYGQTNIEEVERARKIAKEAKSQHRVFDVSGILRTGSLVTGENHNSKSSINSDLPASFVGGRNLLFLTITASYCAEFGINDIVIGACQSDFNGYPDCRRNTITAMELSLSLGMGMGDIRIHSPLMYLSKAEIWKLSKELGCIDVIVNDTLTDYNGNTSKMNEWGVGDEDNNGSKLRAEGYREAKMKGWI